MSFFDGLLENSGGILSSLAGIGLGFFGDQNDLPNDVEDILDRQEGAIDALIDPNDPKFRQLAQSLEQDKVSSFAEGIRNYQNLLRRGRLTGAVNPERRDEGISQAFGRARQLAGEEARAQAREYLAQAAGLNTGAIPALLAQQQAQNNSTMGAIGASGDLLDYIFRSRQPQTTVNITGAGGSLRPNVRGIPRYGSVNAASYSDPSRYYG